MKRPFKLIVINSSVCVCVTSMMRYGWTATLQPSHYVKSLGKTSCFPSKSRVVFLLCILPKGLSLGRNNMWKILIIVAKI